MKTEKLKHFLQTQSELLFFLKNLPRTGWQHSGISTPETVASHSYGVFFWTFFLMEDHPKKEEIDTSKTLLMAMLHDYPESLLGDLTPIQKKVWFGDSSTQQNEAIFLAEKRFWERQEKENETLDGFWKKCQELWQEYRFGASLEAQIVKQADALDCFLQAHQYRSKNMGSLEEFSSLWEKASAGNKEWNEVLQELWQKSSPPPQNRKQMNEQK